MLKTQEELKEELATLKQKHGVVFSITAELDTDKPDQKATIFLRKSDRMATELVRKTLQTSPIKAVEAGLTNLYIGGDNLKTCLESFDFVLSSEPALVEIVSRQEATLKKN